MKKKLEDPNGLQPWVLKTLKSTGENLIILFVTFDIMLGTFGALRCHFVIDKSFFVNGYKMNYTVVT